MTPANNILSLDGADGRLVEQRDRRGDGLGIGTDERRRRGEQHHRCHVDGVGPATFMLTVRRRGGVGERERARLEPSEGTPSRRRSSHATRRTTSCR